MLEALNALRIKASEVYAVHDLHLQRDTVSLSFEDGELGFLDDFQGKLTGAVFTGSGHVVAIPRGPGERQSMARFLGVPVLDQDISAAYLRFMDDAGEQLRRQMDSEGAEKTQDPGFLAAWNANAEALDAGHSLRIMMDLLADKPVPYLFAGCWSSSVGRFELVVDDRRTEQVSIGQMHDSPGPPTYDIWTSFARGDIPGPPMDSFQPISYAISTTIEPDYALEGETTINLRAQTGGERLIALSLSRYLTVQSVEDSDSNSLTFFQNESLSRDQLAEEGNDVVVVVLPRAPAAGETPQLRFTYRGEVLSNAGNGVIFVGDRGSWYPHLGSFGNFASFDLTFHWPRRLHLIATGIKQSEVEEGEWEVGHWRSEGEIPVAGFNLGDYRTDDVALPDGRRVEVLANSQLELSLEALFHAAPLLLPGPDSPFTTSRRVSPAIPIPDEPPEPLPAPSPADFVHQIAEMMADAVRLEERWLGPLPFSRLEVTQIPGDFGQGWPGLIYLPTVSFLSQADQEQVGLSKRTQEDFNEIVPFHEVAHQWLGNEVGWESYRDQWIDEGLANYVALLALEARNPDAHILKRWLDQYRIDLSHPASGGDTVADIGPVTLGIRLASARDPGAYQKIVYGKGTWIFQMLRMMLRDPSGSDPDARFVTFLHGLVRQYHDRPLSTSDLQTELEKVMTPSMALEEKNSMAWFFDEWVYGTGIPHYAVQYDVRPRGNKFQVDGTLTQDGVPDEFLAAVPLYSQAATGRPELLGIVVTAGKETHFRLIAASLPKHLLIDPQQTLLCMHD